MMTLYGYWRSSASYRVRIGLNLKGIAVRHLAVNLKNNEQLAPDWAIKNPQNLVPVLELEDGTVLRQSLPILEYLDDQFPTHALLPKNAVERASIRACANIIASEVAPLQNLRVLKKLRSDHGLTEDQSQNWCRHWISLGLAALEHTAVQSSNLPEFLFSDQAGLVECVFIPQLYNARRFNVDLSPYPRLLAVEAKCLALPAFQKAHPDQQADAPHVQKGEGA